MILAGAVPFYMTYTDSNQCGAVRARRKCVLRLLSTESERSGAIACARKRKPVARWTQQLTRRSTAVHRWRESSSWRSGLV